MIHSHLYILLLTLFVILCNTVAIDDASIEAETLYGRDRSLRKRKGYRSKHKKKPRKRPPGRFPKLGLVTPYGRRKRSWFYKYKAYMKEEHSKVLKKCGFIRGRKSSKFPATGGDCKRWKNDYMCMFGLQKCQSKEVKGKKHPKWVCECSDGKLTCNEWKPCEGADEASKNYVALPNPDTDDTPDVEEPTECPTIEPKNGFSCNWSDKYCLYGEFC